MKHNIIALNGSQRAASWCGALLQAAETLAPASLCISMFEDHKTWPLFNPDLDGNPPDSVLHLRGMLDEADALLIASPEYAQGVSGTIKNTLDWLVSHPGMVGKPVAVLNPSLQSHHADEALKHSLRAMSTVLVTDACVRIPVCGSHVNPAHIANEPRFSAPLTEALLALERHLRSEHTQPVQAAPLD
jgi:chromate reductase, NAD(P)H dehydrogenase (quinone)